MSANDATTHPAHASPAPVLQPVAIVMTDAGRIAVYQSGAVLIDGKAVFAPLPASKRKSRNAEALGRIAGSPLRAEPVRVSLAPPQMSTMVGAHDGVGYLED